MIRNTLMTAGLAVAMLAMVSPALASGPQPLGAILSADTVEGEMGNAKLRVIHASPDAPNVDVWANGSVVISDLAFNEISDYLTVPAGAYDVKVEPAGAGGAGPFVIDAMLTLEGGTNYTVLATNVLEQIAPVILVDNYDGPMAGNAAVRFFHGSPDAPAVDIAVADGGPVLFPAVAFQETGDYLEVPAATYDLEVRLAGTETVVLTLPGIALEEGVAYSAYATGLAADGFADRTMYLNDDRFRIEVAWTDFEGNTGVGYQSELTGDTGTFWFFTPNNIELVVKALDGRTINGNWWLFYGSLSNVQYEITVTDTMTDETKVYTNDLGNFGSVGDTEAFVGGM